ncbi:hypothetical protein [Flavobacterium sp. LHD-85]|uniref:hypothetical protein n=1 Tax=Flavobacterium sp. LHD-85 TaxID=3071410 RepID=UPI0027E0BB46|nr:hypothetical protein [Flavobacterium sp. LHD-85]MDQ6527673.1 hypothetical protein [Flavobacterium sp. LHD-85]
MKNFLFLFCLSVFFVSCNDKKKDQEFDYMSESIEKLVVPMKKCYKNIIVLPGSGCDGCISEGETFLAENYKNDEYLFVLTNINSLKIISHKIGIDVTKYSNIYIDDNNVFSKKNNLIYPLVAFYSCDSTKVSYIKIQKPGNDAFRGL